MKNKKSKKDQNALLKAVVFAIKGHKEMLTRIMCVHPRKIDTEDWINWRARWEMVVPRLGKIDRPWWHEGDGFDILQLEDDGFKPSEIIQHLKLFVEINGQLKKLETQFERLNRKAVNG